MIDVFISYAKEDRAVARDLAAQLDEWKWEVYWDRRIDAGMEWSEEIQRAVREARCVLVLWSAASVHSFWVRGEAAEAFERNTYLPLLLDGAEVPRLFRQRQALSIAKWVDHTGSDEIHQLKFAIESRLPVPGMRGNLERVADNAPVESGHLHLVHSCWRVDKMTEYGLMPFQIHVVVYGHHTALARISSVDYSLPGYPQGHAHQTVSARERLFELKELANGFCCLQARVNLHAQPPGHKPILLLSRFINMSEIGPRLEDFIRAAREPWRE